MTPRPDQSTDDGGGYPLSLARVLRVSEDGCEVVDRHGRSGVVGFAPVFPGPRTERVSPGHLVAVASGPGSQACVVWRWYDAVVIADGPDGTVRLWEPAHGEVDATPRSGYQPCEPGARAYASSGLPGASWWVMGRVGDAIEEIPAELVEVDALYRENGLWPTVFPEHEED